MKKIVELRQVMARSIIRFRWAICVCALVVLGLSAGGLSRLRMDSSNESFMPEGDQVTLNNDAFKSVFGSEEFFFILLETDSLWSARRLEELDRLALDIEENLPFVDDVLTLTTAEIMRSHDGDLVIESMRDTGIPSNQEDLDFWKDQLERSLLYRKRILSDVPGQAGLLVSMKSLPESVKARVAEGYSPFNKEFLVRDRAFLTADIVEDNSGGESYRILEDPRKAVAASLLSIINEYSRDDFSLRVTGMPVIDRGVDDLTGTESGFFGLLSLAASALILWILYRRVMYVLSPLVVFVSSAVVLFGVSGFAGMTVNIMTIVIVPLLLVISVGYSVHIMNGMNRFLVDGTGDRKEALVLSLRSNLWPCFLSAITTALGFLSFIFVPMKPIRDLGLQCSAGTIITFIYSISVVPFLLSLSRSSPHTKVNPVAGVSPGSHWVSWTRMLFARSSILIPIFLAISVISVFGLFRITPGVELLNMVGEGVPFVRDTWYISERLGGAYSAEFRIEVSEDADLGEVLRTIDGAAALAREYDDVTMTFSLADMVRELNRVLGSGGDIPSSATEISQFLLLYELSGGDTLSSWTDMPYRNMRLSVLLGGRSGGFEALEEGVGNYLRTRLPEGSIVTFAGDVPVMLRMMNLVVDGQKISTLVALAMITVVLILVLRSLRSGLVAAIPNIFPVLCSLGILGWTGWRLDFVTVMVAPMLIGIAVDDTIHFFVHFRSHHGMGESIRHDVEKTFVNIGNSLVFTSIILAGGFTLFAFSRMTSLRHMGILASVGIISALIADLVLSPLLLSFVYARKEKRAANSNELEETHI